MPFQAGQFVLWAFDIDGKTVKRSYSIYSSPQDMESDSHLSLLVKQTSQPYVSAYLTQDINIGDQVIFTGPLGHLTVAPDVTKLLMISIGSGVTPIASILQDWIQKDHYKHIINIYGEKYRDHIPAHTRDLFHQNHHCLQSYIYLSQEVEWLWYQVGHVQDALTDILPLIDDTRTVIICGKPTFVDEMVQILVSHGVNKTCIKSEKY